MVALVTPRLLSEIGIPFSHVFFREKWDKPESKLSNLSRIRSLTNLSPQIYCLSTTNLRTSKEQNRQGTTLYMYHSACKKIRLILSNFKIYYL